MAAERNAHDGVDALMAAITDEPLPDAARADAGFMAEHAVATADVALLREQLGIIGEALSAPPAPEPVTRPGPSRPSRRRHPALRVLAYGTLVTAVIAGTVTGVAWLGAHNGGAGADSSSAQSKSDAAAKASGDGPPPSDPEQVLACDRLVVEGTVARVETRADDPWTTVVLTVIRSYKPAKSPSQVSFLLDGGANPKPRTGQHVLVEVGRGQQNASLWAVGDTRVAANRAWIVEALPGSLRTTCSPG
ncbi:hypothetical protein ABTY96_27830 [Streptomyces sp. NPDC096057]|uniref:hypothetical protein n=1 Tax=Streptomyces sp. NPDC096057 TaxID=3155543 RepID=UPI0033334A27